jgi:hypothetical protein
MKKLTITINVENEVEAYKIVSRLGFEHKIIEADLNGYAEKFNKTNQPNMFLKDNKKVAPNIFKKLIK